MVELSRILAFLCQSKYACKCIGINTFIHFTAQFYPTSGLSIYCLRRRTREEKLTYAPKMMLIVRAYSNTVVLQDSNVNSLSA